MADHVSAFLTDQARRYHARQLAEGIAWGEYEFAVGGGGFDPSLPHNAVKVDPKATSLDDLVFGPEPVDGIERPNDRSVAFYCVLERDEANFEIGEIAVYAEITHSPEEPALVGTKFIYALAHHASKFKTSSSRLAYRVCVQV